MASRKRSGPGVNKQHQELPPQFKRPKPAPGPVPPAKQQDGTKKQNKKQLIVAEEELDHIPLESKSAKKNALLANERLEERDGEDGDALAELEGAEDPDAAFEAPADDYDSEAEADIAAYRPGQEAESGSGDDSSAASPEEFKGVLYIGHIPYGFFERPLRAYLSQFGAVRHLRLARNRRTGRSKHYAFVQFEDASVARVVAETMNGYFLYGRTLVVQEVPPERVHPHTFHMADRKFRTVPWRALARSRHNRPRDRPTQKGRAHHLIVHENRKRALLARMGINYSFGGYAGHVKVAARALQHQDAKSSARKDSKKQNSSTNTKESTPTSAKITPKKIEQKPEASTPSKTPRKGSNTTPSKQATPRPAAEEPVSNKKAKKTAATTLAQPLATTTHAPTPAKSPKKPSEKSPAQATKTSSAATPAKSPKKVNTKSPTAAPKTPSAGTPAKSPHTRSK